MKLTERRMNGLSIIDIAGDLTVPAENPRALREKVAALVQRGERRVLLNVANLRHLDSSFVGEMVASYKTMAAQGGVLMLAHVSPHLQNVLRTTNLDALFKSFETEADAVARLTESVS